MAKDVDLFARAMADVKPLKARRPFRVVPRAKPEGPLKTKERSLAAAGTTPKARPKPAEPELAADAKGFDRDIDRALSRGRLEPEARLDLHGMALATAERAVTRFLEQAIGQDCRVALIITGKGYRREDGRIVEGRIRAEFVGWLNRAENRARVRAVRAAHPRHGGTGAFYVLLRRRSAASKRSLRSTPQR